MSAPAYTGDVEVGGPAAVRELPGLTITKLAVSEMANNAYLLRCTATGEALLIDAAAEPDTLRALIGDADLRTVVTTHGHWDHHRALPEIVEATGAQTVAHPADAADLPVPVQRTGRARRHRDRRRADARGRAPARAHPGQHRAGVARAGRRRGARVHRRQPVPRRRRQHAAGRRPLHQPDRRRRGAAVRRAPGRARGSTPATAGTRRWAPSARTSAEWRARGW